MFKLILLISTGLYFFSCSEAKTSEEILPLSDVVPEFFSFSGFGLVQSDTAQTSLAEATNLFNVGEDNTIEPATDQEIKDFEVSEQGIVVKLSGESIVFADKNGNISEPIASPSTYALNFAGNVFYELNGQYFLFDFSTGETEEYNISFDFPNLKGISGNFIVYGNSETVQVLDTVSKNRFNIADCNSSRIVAIDATRVLVNDCNEKQLMNMTDGSRSVLSVTGLAMNHESVPGEDAAILLSQGCNSDASLNYDLCSVDSDGVVTRLTTMGFDVGTAASTVGEGNNVLFSDGDHIIVKELNQVSLVERGFDEKVSILTGLNIISISVKSGIIFYSAEDIQGNAVLGKYSIADSESTEVDSSTRYSKVRIY